jgi:hypothetical protein
MLSKDQYDRLPPEHQAQYTATSIAILRERKLRIYTCVPTVALGILGGILILMSAITSGVGGKDMMEGSGEAPFLRALLHVQ